MTNIGIDNSRPNAKPDVSPADQQIIRQTFGFLRGIVANPELAKDIPDGANVVLIPTDDPEMAAIEIEAGMLALSRGLDVYFRYIRPGGALPICRRPSTGCSESQGTIGGDGERSVGSR